jgi:hypothetical protein
MKIELLPKEDLASLDDRCGDSSRVFIGGDWSPPISGNPEFVLKAGADYYGSLRQVILSADLAMLNVEMVLSDSSKPRIKSGVSALGSPEMATHLKSIGFNLGCLSNNHILDAGEQGLRDTIRHLNDAGISTTGAATDLIQVYQPFEHSYSGQKTVVINVSDGLESNEYFNSGKGAADIRCWRAAREIRVAKESGALVIVIAHAGSEFLPVPSPRIKRAYREFVELGADIVVGHHPHVIQGYELWMGRPIFYSIGNFGICRGFRRLAEEQGIAISIDFGRSNTIDRIAIVPIWNLPDGIRVHDRKSISHFLEFWDLANRLLKDDLADLVWSQYLQLYDLKSKPADLFAAQCTNPVHANHLFDNLLVDYSSPEHSSLTGQNQNHQDWSVARAALEKWGVGRRRSSLSKVLSLTARSTARFISMFNLK